MVEIIEGQPSGLEMFLQGVNPIAQQGLSQLLQKQQQRASAKSIASSLGKPEYAQLLGHFNPDQQLEALKLLQGQEQLKNYMQTLQNAGGESEAQDQFAPPIQNEDLISGEAPSAPETGEAPRPAQKVINPILPSRMVPPPTSAHDILAHSQAVNQARQSGFEQHKAYIEKAREEGEGAEKIRPILKNLYRRVKSGEVSGLSGYIQKEFGEKFPFLKGADVKDFQRGMKELTVNRMSKDFGGRPTGAEFFYIADVYGQPGDNKEALIRGLVLEDWVNQIKQKRNEAINDIFNKYGEYPLNLNSMVEQRLRPTYDKFLKQTGYYDWLKKEKSPKQITDTVMRKYLEANQGDPEKALEQLKRDNFQVVE
jgi:hypothetical protein